MNEKLAEGTKREDCERETMNQNTGDSTEDVLDDLAATRRGGAVGFDEAGTLSPGKRLRLERTLTELTPERMDHRVRQLRRRVRETND